VAINRITNRALQFILAAHLNSLLAIRRVLSTGTENTGCLWPLTVSSRRVSGQFGCGAMSHTATAVSPALQLSAG
jgi:hypothetical protein